VKKAKRNKKAKRQRRGLSDQTRSGQCRPECQTLGTSTDEGCLGEGMRVLNNTKGKPDQG
jgi:hypothetical protein